MKTKIISKLKKELLLVELPENKNTFDDLTFLNSEIDGYNLLGTPDEIKEEDVSEFVKQSIFTSLYGHYVSGIDVNTYCYKTAIKSFNSALESEIYWNVNPYRDVKGSVLDMTLGQWMDKKNFLEAQEKTFDRNRSIILVKN